jgi:hypothetical protein
LEANFYFGTTASADESLTTLRCPLLMTTSDTGEVSIRLTNDTNRDLAPSIITDISTNNVFRSGRENYPLAAGETRTLGWTVTSDDVVFGHLIMARVFVFSAFTMPSRAGTCGTVVVDLPGLSGAQLFVIVLAFIIGCMTAGWGLWLAGSRPFQTEELITLRAMVFFTITLAPGLIAGVIGWWLVGLICAVACLLLIIVVVGYYIQKS